MQRFLMSSVVTLFTVALIVPVNATQRGSARGPEPAAAESDFNGDGFSDLATGASREDTGGAEDAGVVHVLYGSGGGLLPTDNELWSQDTVSDAVAIENGAEDGDFFGSEVATGDLNRDGYADLIVGVPGEDAGDEVDGEQVGLVNVIYGSAGGLTGVGNHDLWQGGQLNGTGIKGSPARDDDFGASLETGNFGKSGADDLAVGIPGESVGGKESAGAVQVFYGKSSGLGAAGQQLWHRDSKQNGVAIKGSPSGDDALGEAISSGDFGKSGKDDLVVAVSEDNLKGKADAGSLNVIYGAKTGLVAKGNQLWHQDSPGVKDEVEVDDVFAFSVSGADFGRSQHEDLAIGVLGEAVGGNEFAGAVNVLYGSATGLTGANSQFFHQNSEAAGGDMQGAAEADDGFGRDLQAANFGSGGRDDLAIGVSSEDLGDVEAAGVIQVLFGGANGLVIPGNQLISQDSAGVLDTAEPIDALGVVLGAADYNADGKSDLTAGIPDEDIGAVQNAGAVQVFYGYEGGIEGAEGQFWHQDSADIQGGAEEFDSFGRSVNQP